MEIKVTSCKTCPFQTFEGSGWGIESVCSYNVYIKGDFEPSWDGYMQSTKATYDNGCPLVSVTINISR